MVASFIEGRIANLKNQIWECREGPVEAGKYKVIQFRYIEFEMLEESEVKMHVVEYIGLELGDINRGLGVISLYLWHNNKDAHFHCLICAKNKEKYSLFKIQ